MLLLGFGKVYSGPERGSFYHPKFLRGERELCLTITRKQGLSASCKSGVSAQIVDLWSSKNGTSFGGDKNIHAKQVVRERSAEHGLGYSKCEMIPWGGYHRQHRVLREPTISDELFSFSSVFMSKHGPHKQLQANEKLLGETTIQKVVHSFPTRRSSDLNPSAGES